MFDLTEEFLKRLEKAHGVAYLSAVSGLVAGPVLALACSLGAFLVIWVSDWPARRPGGEERYVRMEELQLEDELD